MADFEMYFSDEEREKAEAEKRANIIPLKSGEPTEDELIDAFEMMFREEWRKHT